jgi:hypothetical protein
MKNRLPRKPRVAWKLLLRQSLVGVENLASFFPKKEIPLRKMTVLVPLKMGLHFQYAVYIKSLVYRCIYNKKKGTLRIRKNSPRVYKLAGRRELFGL